MTGLLSVPVTRADCIDLAPRLRAINERLSVPVTRADCISKTVRFPHSVFVQSAQAWNDASYNYFVLRLIDRCHYRFLASVSVRTIQHF